MSAFGPENDLATLLRRAEQAIHASRPRDQVKRLLHRVLEHAVEGTDAARFAHLHLAELELEAAPWTAALHIRRVLTSAPEHDAAHALMGLCQAVQGNHRAAVAAYRRAVSLAPGNPWYNHNLGHILDVALDAPRDALPYLRRAHRDAPDQEEVGASLVHCLGRIGELEEALSLARSLLQRHPHHDDLRRLLRWIESGAARTPRAKSPPELHTVTPAARPAEPDDASALARLLRRAGATDAEIARAARMWRDFVDLEPSRMCEVTAAALDYALARIDGEPAHQREVARRHGVSSQALSTRFRELKAALRITPRDARYA